MIFLNKMDKVKINIVHLPKKNIEIDDGEEYHISTFLSTNILTGTSPNESQDKVLILSTNDEAPVISTDVVPVETPVISTDVVPDETPVISTDDEIKLLIKNKQYDELRKILPPIAYQIIMEKEVGRSLPTPTGCLKEYKELYRKKQTTSKATTKQTPKETKSTPKQTTTKQTTPKQTTTKLTTPKQTMTNSYVEQMKNKHKIKSTIINTRGSSISSNDYVTLMKRRHGAG